MMSLKKILIGLVGVILLTDAYAQNDKNALNGIRCASGDLYFDHDLKLRLDSESFSHRVLEDSIYLLMPRYYNIYLKAYNPLHYTHKEGMKINLSQVELGFNVFLTTLSESTESIESSQKSLEFSFYNSHKDSNNGQGGSKQVGQQSSEPCEKCQPSLNSIENAMNTLIKFVKKDTSKKVHDYINKLIEMPFVNELATRKELTALKTQVAGLEKEYKKALKQFDEVATRMKYGEMNKVSFDLSDINHLNEYLVKQMLSNLKNIALEQQKRVSNLKQLIKSMETVINSWSNYHDVKTNEWFIKVEANYLENDVTKTLNIELTSHKMSYSPGDESLTKGELKKKSKHYKMTRFHWLRPQIYAGTIYSFRNRESYFASLNEDGDLVVASSDQEPLERVNLAMVMNWNLYTNHSTVTPFLQAGVALNQSVPMALIGGGMSFNFGTNKSLALSGGVSITGIEELNGLDLGDEVESSREVENALEYVGAPLKAYIGIEIKF